MAYRPIDRSSSGIVFFGSATTDQTFESNSNFRIDPGNSRAILSNITVADGGKIGSASRTGILTFGSDGIATFSSGVVIDGNLTINGTTTTINTETIELSDNIIVLNSNFSVGVPTENAGIQIKRGDSTDVVFRWNETSDFWDFTNDGSTYFEIASRTGNQTLLNKTIDGNNNTLQNIGNASLTNSSLTVVAGSGLVNGGTVSLGGTTTLNVGAGNGVTVAADTISVTKGSGIIVDANGVHVNVNPSVLSIATDQVTIATSGVNNTHLNASVINSQPVLTGTIDATNDFVLIYDDSASSLRKINRENLLSGIVVNSDFFISDGTNSQTIKSNDTLTFQPGAAISFTVGATDSVSGILNSFVAGSGLSMVNQALNIGAGSGISVAADSISVLVNSDLGINATGLFISNGAITEIKRSRTVSSISTTSTLSSDINLCTAGAGGITVTLPDVAIGKKIVIKKIDSGAGTVIIERGGSSTIDGANIIQLYYQYEAVTLVSDGTNWFIT